MNKGTITLQDVKKVQIGHCQDINEKANREITITFEDGTELTIDLWTTAEELKLEIN